MSISTTETTGAGGSSSFGIRDLKWSKTPTADDADDSKSSVDAAPFSAPASASRLNIDDLPDDVLFEILTATYAHKFPQCHLEKYDLLAHSPVAFSQVSRRLRRVALALPEIWSCVHITPRFIQHSDRNLALQLSRSHNHPLSITFICRNVYHTEEGGRSECDDSAWTAFVTGPHFQRFKRCWDLLLEHVSRWRHLALSVGSHAILFSLLNDARLSRSKIPLLEHADICAARRPWFTLTPGARMECEQPITAPRLTRLRVNNACPVPLSGFTHLTTLVFARDELPIDCVDELQSILDVTGATLETLILHDIKLKRSDHGDGAPFKLPRLHYLSLKTVDGVRDWAVFLSRFSQGAPKLTRLHLSMDTLVNTVFPATSTLPVFHSVTELHLRLAHPLNPLSGYPGPFVSAFPAVQRMVVDMLDEVPICFLLPVGKDGVQLELEPPGACSGRDYRDLRLGDPQEPWACLTPDTLTLILHEHQSSLQRLAQLARVRAAIGHPIKTLVIDESFRTWSPRGDMRRLQEGVSALRLERLEVDWGLEWDFQAEGPTVF